jgi:polyhydroxybutyrate depolymerase
MRNTSLRALANQLGVAFVAPDAIMDDWSIPGAPSQSTSPDIDELAYFDALRQALITTHGIEAGRLVVAGFSAGGMMVWNLACNRPQDYAGFIPIAGTFWDPVPSRCATPAADIVHIHGTSDKIVPLTGRPIAETSQGNVTQALEMYRATGGHTATTAPQLDPNLSCEAWQTDTGTKLVKCLHPGGHGFKASYVEGAWTLIAP